MSKPRISRGRITGEYWCYDPPLGFNFDINKCIGYGSTPEAAYWNYIENKASYGSLTEWHKYQPRPEPLINITYLDPEEMSKNLYKPVVTFKVVGCDEKPWWRFWK